MGHGWARKPRSGLCLPMFSACWISPTLMKSTGCKPAWTGRFASGKPGGAGGDCHRPTAQHFSPTSDSTHEFTLVYRVLGAIRQEANADALIWRLIPEEHDYIIQRNRFAAYTLVGLIGGIVVFMSGAMLAGVSLAADNPAFLLGAILGRWRGDGWSRAVGSDDCCDGQYLDRGRLTTGLGLGELL